MSVVCRNGAARVGGFSLHAGIELAADQREPLERLCRYVSRPPVAEQRLALMPLGQVRYTLTTPWRDGTTQIVHEPLDPTGSRSRARPNRSDAPGVEARRRPRRLPVRGSEDHFAGQSRADG